MIVSYNWLQEYFEEKLPEPKALGNILNTRAFEVEGIEAVADDFAIDIDVLPNRAHDCLAHDGVAKEIAVHTGLVCAAPDVQKVAATSDNKIAVAVDDNVPCVRYISRVVSNVAVQDSPKEIVAKLQTLGQRSINAVVDLTNIVMYEMGQPMHAFDADKIVGSITVRFAQPGEQLTTLDNKDLELTGNEMVIADDEGPLALAGIKGGKRAEVDAQTKNIVLEAANFAPSVVRKISSQTGISTDSSKRFERAITPELAARAMQRLTALLAQYAATNATTYGPVVDVYPRTAGVYKTGVSLEQVQSYLGIPLAQNDIEAVFAKLGFTYTYVSAKEKFTALLKEQEGKPYVFGASVLRDAPNGFDCSSLVAYAAKESGLSIPRMVIDQYVWATEIAEDDLEPGDLIFSNKHTVNEANQTKFTDRPEIQAKVAPEHDTSKEFLPGTKIERPVDHVGTYLGDGKVIHCTNTHGVIIESLNESESFKDIVSYRRIFSADEQRYVVTVPDERLDIRIPADVIEEIARVHGYEHIEGIPIADPAEVTPNAEYIFLNTVRALLVEQGFSEVMTPTFVATGDIETAKAIASDKGFLRTNLRDGLIAARALNEKNSDLLGLDRVRIFEIGHVFTKTGEALHIALAVSGKKSEQILADALNAIGLEDKVQEGCVEVAIDLENLPQVTTHTLPEVTMKAYEPFSPYPFMLRDIAVWVPAEKTQEGVLSVITKHAGDLLVRTTLFDVFEKEGRTSYAFRLVFQSYEKTLTDDEVNVIMDAITNELNEQDGFEVR